MKFSLLRTYETALPARRHGTTPAVVKSCPGAGDRPATEYEALQADVAAGRPATFQVDGVGYASRTRHGLKLSGCNLFFSMGGG